MVNIYRNNYFCAVICSYVLLNTLICCYMLQAAGRPDDKVNVNHLRLKEAAYERKRIEPIAKEQS